VVELSSPLANSWNTKSKRAEVAKRCNFNVIVVSMDTVNNTIAKLNNK